MEGVEIALAVILTLFPSHVRAAAGTAAPSNHTSVTENTAVIGATAFNVTGLEETNSTAAGNSTTPTVDVNKGKGMNLKGYKNVTGDVNH